ncbi:MAG: M48 family metalloprotease [Myxococcota bacterium]
MVFRSLTLRALLALGLLVGFYTFGLALGLGLLGGAYAIVVIGHRIPLKLVALMVIGGCTVLWSLIPRGSKFEPPGPEITKRDQPRLFALIEEIASKMQQVMPTRVYLMPDVNAFVTQRGGFLGIGGHRVMGMGLGLLAADNVSQLRATIAHEFGHFAGGDTKLGGLIYATRSAMLRTMANLQGSWLRAPFEWFWAAYMRLTQAISRQQELLADEWSVKLAGKTAHISGLRAEAMHGAGFQVFFGQEVRPLLGQGVGPENVFDGYRRFAKSSAWGKIEGVLAKMTQEHQADPFDSHPALEERIAYAEKLGLPDRPMDETPAFTLLDDPAKIEVAVSGEMLPERIERLSWENMSEHFAAPVLRSGRRWQARNPELNVGSSLALLADPVKREEVLLRSIPAFSGARYQDLEDDRRTALSELLAGYFAAMLKPHGFAWKTAPGEPLRLEREGVELALDREVRAVVAGEKKAEELQAILQSVGLSPEAQLELTEIQRTEARARRARVRVTETKDGAEIRAAFGPLLWPRCCAICLGAFDELIWLDVPIGGGQSGAARVRLGACNAHRPQITSVLTASAYEKSTDTVTLKLKSAAYAKLVETVNG